LEEVVAMEFLLQFLELQLSMLVAVVALAMVALLALAEMVAAELEELVLALHLLAPQTLAVVVVELTIFRVRLEQAVQE
jgi:hypothetical protein